MEVGKGGCFSPAFGNRSLRDKSGLWLVFGNKDLLEHNPSFINVLSMHLCCNGRVE